MIYEVAWLAFAVGIMVLLSIGLLGLFFSFSIPSPLMKNCAMVLSVLIVLAGLYFSYKWTTNKKNIQNLDSHKYFSNLCHLRCHTRFSFLRFDLLSMHAGIARTLYRPRYSGELH